mgnify:CR=1 FL=1
MQYGIAMSPKTSQPTLRVALARGLRNAATIICLIMTTVFAVSACDSEPVRRATPESLEIRSTPTPIATTVNAMLIANDCWTNEQDIPADMVGKLPGHVVVTVGNDDEPTYGGARLVGLALEQIPKEYGGLGIDHNLRVHGFCR